MSGGASLADQRKVKLDGMLNARDLGGMPAAKGKQVRRGQILRMDSPHHMGKGAADQVIADGFTTVLDLRYPVEVADHGIGHFASDDVRHVNVPIASSANQAAPGLTEMLQAADGRPLAEVVAIYYRGYFTTNDGAAITEAVREMVRPDGLPMIVHCAAGKDRTGCVVATALSAVGVPDDVVADDYAASAEAVPAIMARLSAAGYGEFDDSLVDLQRTRAETMLQVLQWLREEYGGARQFLRDRGMSDDELARLEVLLVTDAE